MGRLTIRLSRELERSINEFRAGSELGGAEAARKLIEAGLQASRLDGFDIVKAVVAMLDAQSELRDRVSAIEADTRQVEQHLNDLSASSESGVEHLEALRGWADDMQSRSRPFLDMICEIYMVGRLFTSKKFPDQLERLFALGDQQYAIFEERARRQVGSKQVPGGGSSSAKQAPAGGATTRVQRAAKAA